MTRAREKFIEAFEGGTETYGMRPSLGRVYALLYLDPDPLSFDELVERSGYTKTEVSDALHALQQLRLVEERSKGDDSIRFAMAGSAREVVRDEFPAMLQEEVDLLRPVFESAEETLEAAPPGERRDRHLEKVREFQEHLDETDTMLSRYDRLPNKAVDAVLKFLF